MLWAREILGICSMAKAVMPALAHAWTSARLLMASSLATSTAPFLKFLSSSPAPPEIGRWTLNTISAVFSAAAASLAMVAPASLKASSVIAAFSPAPVSTVTSKPRPMSFLTTSGDAATRVSPARRSFGIAIFMMLEFLTCFPCALFLFWKDYRPVLCPFGQTFSS